MKRRPLSLAIALLLPGLALGQEAPPERHERAKELEALIVTASPLRPSSEDVIKPITILSGAELDAKKAATLGETVAREVGVQSSFFGAGVGRPIIRGQEGARVQVLQGGIGSLDASTVSVDHAVSIEPFLADQIEILKGPATLLYGTGAIGGAVNVEDGRIADSLPEDRFSGRAELRGNTVNSEEAGMFRLDLANERGLVLHLDGFYRDTADYKIPAHAELEVHDEDGHEQDEEGHDDEDGGRLENSAVNTQGGAVGLSFIAERGFLGASLSTYRSDYGIPGHAHGHNEHDDVHDDDHDNDHEEEAEEAVTLKLKQNRVDIKGSLLAPFGNADRLTVRLAHADYQHIEFEGDEVGTVFNSKAIEGRLEVVQPLGGNWRSAWGTQLTDRDFEAEGEEAFVPPSRSRDLGLFWLAEHDSDDWKWELGARYDRADVRRLDQAGRASFSGFSASAGALWRLTEAVHVSLGMDRAQRMPTAEELFSNGPHVATQSFEIGNENLRRETANQMELAVHVHVGPLHGKASVYQNRFDDFIYLADTGEAEDELPVRAWTQADARFNGFEAEAALRVIENELGDVDLRFFGDSVRASLTQGGNLPRIAPNRFGAEALWAREGWRAGMGVVRYGTQGRVADMETPTEGYSLINAHLSYHFDLHGTGWEVFLDGNNLGNREARAHTSFLKDRAPLPGRSLAFGMRAFF
jgi:iron complex outermembrane receptor protein